MRCNICGKELNANDKFCDACGARIENQQINNQYNQQMNNMQGYMSNQMYQNYNPNMQYQNQTPQKKKSGLPIIFLVIGGIVIVSLCAIAGFIVANKSGLSLFGKKLTCTMKEEQDGIGELETSTIFKFDKEGLIVEEATMTFEIEYDDEVEDSTKKLYERIFENICEDGDAPSVCTTTSKGNKFKFKATGTADELGYDNNATYEELKEEMESSDYTCK